MLRNQFNAGTISGSSLRNAITRNGVVAKKSELLQVRAEANEGRLQSSTVGKLVSGVLGGSKKDHGNHNTVVYKGTIVVVKKLLALDQIDRGAVIQDDISEIRGKHVWVQLVGNELDSKTEKTLMSSPVRVKGWASKLGTVQLHFTFKMDFEVPRGMGAPGSILVRNDHPNEFLLVAFSLTLDDSKTDVHYMTNSWVYNTSRSGARIFLQNKAYLPDDTAAPLREL